MYCRIKKNFEVEMLRKEFCDERVNQVFDLMLEKLDMLESAYGHFKDYMEYGGEILFFTTKEDFEEIYPQLLTEYKLKENEAEYTDDIVEVENVIWREKLFLLGSEYALVLVYSEGRVKDE